MAQAEDRKELIERYLMGRMPQEEAEAFRRALEGDASLREEVEWEAAIIEGIREARIQELKNYIRENVPAGTPTSTIIFRIAASLVIMVGLGWLVWNLSGQDERTAKREMQENTVQTPQAYPEDNATHNWDFGDETAESEALEEEGEFRPATPVHPADSVQIGFTDTGTFYKGAVATGAAAPQEESKPEELAQLQKDSDFKRENSSIGEYGYEDIVVSSPPPSPQQNKKELKALTERLDKQKTAKVPEAATDTIKGDVLLLDTTLQVLLLVESDATYANTNGKQRSYSTRAANSDTSVTRTLPATIEVEFWQSPIGYRGYKYWQKRLQLFGIPVQTQIQLIEYQGKLYLRIHPAAYRLREQNDFSPLEPTRIPSIIDTKE